ncbi:4618_t:CDS:1, partial [Entrophospora sp. SA101]
GYFLAWCGLGVGSLHRGVFVGGQIGDCGVLGLIGGAGLWEHKPF